MVVGAVGVYFGFVVVGADGVFFVFVVEIGVSFDFFVDGLLKYRCSIACFSLCGVESFNAVSLVVLLLPSEVGFLTVVVLEVVFVLISPSEEDYFGVVAVS